MKVLRKKYRVDGNIYDDVSLELQGFKDGIVVETVLVVEEDKGEDKSGVKLNNNSGGK